MDESLLEIRNYDGEGYKPLIDYGEWRVAILNWLDDVKPDLNDTMERHTETDEVFVLTRGKGTLLMGGNAAKVEGIYPEPMELGKIYNIKRNAWHSILLSRDASVLLVENKDTGKENSEYFDLSAEQHRFVMETAKREGFE
jgi:hypothetical protein